MSRDYPSPLAPGRGRLCCLGHVPSRSSSRSSIESCHQPIRAPSRSQLPRPGSAQPMRRSHPVPRPRLARSGRRSRTPARATRFCSQRCHAVLQSLLPCWACASHPRYPGPAVWFGIDLGGTERLPGGESTEFAEDPQLAPSVTAWAHAAFPKLAADRPHHQPGADSRP
jgi:hypothetical protein